MEEIRTTANPTLREDHIEFLGRYGQRRETVVGEVLFRAGTPHTSLWSSSKAR